MARFDFNCPQCGKLIEAENSLRGQVVACPHCDKGIVVPRGNPKLGVIRHSEADGKSEPSSQPMKMSASTFTERVAIPERLTRPVQDYIAPPSKARSKSWTRMFLAILLFVLAGVAVAGATLYGGYLYFGDKPRLERGIAYYEKNAYSKAFKQLLPLAKKGYARAQLYVGDCYANGNGVIMDTGGEMVSSSRRSGYCRCPTPDVQMLF